MRVRVAVCVVCRGCEGAGLKATDSIQPLGEALSVLFLCVRAQNLVYGFPSRIQTITSVSYATSGCNGRSVPDLGENMAYVS